MKINAATKPICIGLISAMVGGCVVGHHMANEKAKPDAAAQQQAPGSAAPDATTHGY